ALAPGAGTVGSGGAAVEGLAAVEGIEVAVLPSRLAAVVLAEVAVTAGGVHVHKAAGRAARVVAAIRGIGFGDTLSVAELVAGDARAGSANIRFAVEEAGRASGTGRARGGITAARRGVVEVVAGAGRALGTGLGFESQERAVDRLAAVGA